MPSSSTPLKLHLGCFDCVVPGWINTDITPHLRIARVPLLASLLHGAGLMTDERHQQHTRGIFRQVRYLDVRKRFPFEDGSVAAVFSSHFLEHLYPDEARACLTEIHRVLRPGGVCRVVVPDLDRIVAEYDRAQPESFLHRVFENPKHRRDKNAHHWHYNETSLVRLLRELGFGAARACSYRQGACPDLELLDNRPEESIYVEGIK